MEPPPPGASTSPHCMSAAVDTRSTSDTRGARVYLVHTARRLFGPNRAKTAKKTACRQTKQSPRRGARCACSPHSPRQRRTPTRAAPHWSTPCASTRGGSTPCGITPVRPPGVHLAQSGRWLLPATRLAVRAFFRRDRAAPCTLGTARATLVRCGKSKPRAILPDVPGQKADPSARLS